MNGMCRGKKMKYRYHEKKVYDVYVFVNDFSTLLWNILTQCHDFIEHFGTSLWSMVCVQTQI